MPRLNTYQQFILTFSSPWNLAGKTSELWAQAIYVSGTITHTAAEAEAAALALAQPALALMQSGSHLDSFTYYAAGATIATAEKHYTATDHPSTQNAYSTAADPQQLEVCAVAHSLLPDKNSRGKPVYLRRYFHSVFGTASSPNTLGPLTDPVALLAPYNTGAGPHAVVPVSPKTGHQGGTWSLESHLFTHQLRRGKKRKPSAAQSLFDQVAQTIGEAAALKLLEKAITSGVTP